MSDAIGPGDTVVCVATPSPVHYRGMDMITLGTFYRIKRVTQHKHLILCPTDACGDTGFILEGKHPRVMYCPNFFRKPGEYYSNLVCEEVGEITPVKERIKEPA